MPFSVPNKQDLQVLISLGLTLRQAKVYLALVQLGVSSVMAISKVSKVARPDVYRIMNNLQKLGLAEKMIDTPVKFKANPIQEGVSILLDHKIKNVFKVSQEAKELIKKYKARETKTTTQEDVKQFVLLPGKEMLIRRLDKAADNAQSSIDVVCPREAFPRGLLTFAKVYEKAMRRGVEIRWILEEPKDRNSWPETVQTLMKNPFFKLRFLPKPPGKRLGIFDKKEAFIATNPINYALESSALWTDNPSILSIMNEFYELLWITAMETPHYTTDKEQT